MRRRLSPQRLRASLRLRVGSLLVFRGTSAEARPDAVRLGSHYGGRVVPLGLLGADSVCYLAGVGEDMSFDVALVKRTECSAWAMDPTPRAIDYVRQREGTLPQGLHFLPIGLWDAEEIKRFYEPSDPAHVSASVRPEDMSESRWFDARCSTVSAIMRDLGHGRLDLLKLDIEGAEYRVLPAVLEERILPGIICLELHVTGGVSEARRLVSRLLSHDYTIIHRHRLDLTLVRNDLVAASDGPL